MGTKSIRVRPPLQGIVSGKISCYFLFGWK
jgi:hypothetical protein